MNSALRTRAKLSESQAIAIFQIKKSSPSTPAAEAANRFRISEKTVRDIWSGRTWTQETWHLDTSRILCHKHIGRPKGCKDSKPRAKKNKEKVPCIDSESNMHAERESDLERNASVDQQLYGWDQAFWIEDESADPFHADWGLQRDESPSP
jgi:hypothetical protein